MVVKDLKEQPNSEFVLLTGAGKPTYYAVDSYDTDAAGTISFFRGTKCVYVCRIEGTWALVSRDAIKLTNDRELTEFQMEDSKVTEAFYEALDPQAWADSKKVAMASMGLPADFGAAQVEKPHPGQYI